MQGENRTNGFQKREGFIDVLLARPIAFSVIWAGSFLVLLSVSWMLDIVPKLETDEDTLASTQAAAARITEGDEPVRIVIDAIGVDALVTNPTSASITALDAALLDGVVHYPGSGDLEDVSNMFLFGHSTGFRVVQNEAFKIFNDLKHLEENDLIRVRSASREYVYRVTSVSLVNANEAFVELSNREKKLTLSTCNSFGSEEERYVVEADFVGMYPVAEAS